MDLLVFAPHPDDAEIFCGGLIAKMATSGKQVVIADLTQGELASRGSIEERSKESEESKKILGIHARLNLKLPDGGIDPEGARVIDGMSQLDHCVKVIRDLKPAAILYPYDKSRHPDHSSTSLLIKKAIFFSGLKKYLPHIPSFSPDLHFCYPMRVETKDVSFIVDITDFAEQKQKAINCYQTQVSNSLKLPKTLVGSKLSATSLIAREGYYGSLIGTQRAEPYIIKTGVRIDNPLEHFANNPVGQATYFNE